MVPGHGGAAGSASLDRAQVPPKGGSRLAAAAGKAEGGRRRRWAAWLRGPSLPSRPLALLLRRLPPQGARQALGGPPPAPIPSSPEAPGSLFSFLPPPLPTFGPAPVSAQTFETRRSASSQTTRAREEEMAEEGSERGGRGPRGTLGSVVRDAGEVPAPPGGRIPEPRRAGRQGRQRSLAEGNAALSRVPGRPRNIRRFKSVDWLSGSAECQFGVLSWCGRSGVGGGERGRVLDSVESETAWRKTARPESLRSRGFCPQD